MANQKDCPQDQGNQPEEYKREQRLEAVLAHPWEHGALSVAIGRTGGGIAIRSRRVGRVTLLQPR